jgi:uncharacterized protein involved in outer membrane biogenesis
VTRRIRLALWALAVVVGVIAAAAIAFRMFDPRAFIERQATSRTGRTAHVGSVTLGWGNPLVVKIIDFRLANAPWGEAPDFVRFANLIAEVEPWPLLSGNIRLRRITLDSPLIALERDKNHIGNWKFHPGGTIVAEPPRRAEFPFIVDLALRGGKITFRTSSGAILRIGIDDLGLKAPTVDGPILIVATGSYNDVKLQLDLLAQSFEILEQPTIPFGIDAVMKAPNTDLTFKGTATAPLDFDGLAGALTIRSANLDDWLSVFGAPSNVAIPLNVAGTLGKQGDHWRLRDAKGQLAGSDFTGSLALDEGKPGAPDHFKFDLDFAPMDLKRVIGLASGGSTGASSAIPLHVAEHPTETYDIRLAVRQAKYGDLALGDARLAATVEPAKISISDLVLQLAGGGVHATASATPAGSGGHGALDAAITQADATSLARLLGGDASVLSGRLDGAIVLEMTGETTNDAISTSRGQAVLGITQGRISRDLLQKVSTNISQIFRRGSGSASLTCVLTIAHIRDGHASIAPLRLRTTEGNLFGGGSIDLRRSRIDLRLKSESKSTGFFALDLPVEITGNLASPQTGLSKNFDAAGINAMGRRNTTALAANVLQVVGHNPCLR